MKYIEKITEIYVRIDDFCKKFDNDLKKYQLQPVKKLRNRKSIMSNSEIICLLVLFHLGGYKNLKHFYLFYVKQHLYNEFPDTVSYNRFTELSQTVLFPMTLFLKHISQDKCTGISFVDSTPLRVCHNRRIHSHKVFKQYADRGHCSLGYFYGFKLHLIINDKGEVLNFILTKGNIDDRQPLLAGNLLKEVWGKVFGDKGYISKQLFDFLFMDGIHLITKIRKNMRNTPMNLKDKLLLRKRAVIESVNDELKNICQIEHTRHRSFGNFLANCISGLIAYSILPKKPSIRVEYTNSRQLALW